MTTKNKDAINALLAMKSPVDRVLPSPRECNAALDLAITTLQQREAGAVAGYVYADDLAALKDGLKRTDLWATPPAQGGVAVFLHPAQAASQEGERKPDGFAYRYPDPMGGGTVIRFTCGQEVNGVRPVEAIPYFYGTPAHPAADKVRVTDAEDKAAQALYSEYSGNHPTIHCNRFPSWSELTNEQRTEWRKKARGKS